MNRTSCQVAPQMQPILRELGLDAETVFTHPSIHVWRKLPDRENAILEGVLADGRTIRLHIKRYPPAGGHARKMPAQIEAHGVRLLEQADIPTVPLLAWGHDGLGRSFLITMDLTHRQAADKAMDAGLPFEAILEPTAKVAADLHAAHLHHRDLYLCHFFVNPQHPEEVPVLIDAARVRKIPKLLPQRWIVKDLAQFHYSVTRRQVTSELMRHWLETYAARRRIPDAVEGLWRRVLAKSAWIAMHDARLNRRQPDRNVSITDAG